MRVSRLTRVLLWGLLLSGLAIPDAQGQLERRFRLVDGVLSFGFNINTCVYTGVVYLPYLPPTVETRIMRELTVVRQASIIVQTYPGIPGEEDLTHEEVVSRCTKIKYLLKAESLGVLVWH